MIQVDESQLLDMELYIMKSIACSGDLPPGFLQLQPVVPKANTVTNRQATPAVFPQSSSSALFPSEDASGHNLPESASQWAVATEYIQAGVIPLLLESLLIDSKDQSVACLSLEILELLCLEPAVIKEIESATVLVDQSELSQDADQMNVSGADHHLKRSGLEVLLMCIDGQLRR